MPSEVLLLLIFRHVLLKSTPYIVRLASLHRLFVYVTVGILYLQITKHRLNHYNINQSMQEYFRW